jgi:hypothetical protein
MFYRGAGRRRLVMVEWIAAMIGGVGCLIGLAISQLNATVGWIVGFGIFGPAFLILIGALLLDFLSSVSAAIATLKETLRNVRPEDQGRDASTSDRTRER